MTTLLTCSPSILLNPSPTFSSKYLPNIPSNNSLSSSSSSSSSTNAALSSSWSSPAQTHSPRQHRSASTPSSSRRIRFAPLPDPRRAVCITDDGDELPLPASAPSAYPSSPAPPLSSSLPDSTTSSDESYHIVHPMPSLLSPSAGSSTPTLTSCKPPSPPSSWTAKPKKFFKPFLKRSSSPCPPMSTGAGFNISAEDILTLGTINLFRSSSRPDSSSQCSSSAQQQQTEGTGGGWGRPLSRWTSAGSYAKNSNSSKEWLGGSPLARTQSAQLQSDNNTRGRSSSSSSAPTTPSTSKSPPSRKGTLMLNGRVYGAKRSSSASTPAKNPFASARDAEPAFVEWGYGGMGSVHNNHHHGGAAAWSRVQSGGGVKVGSHDAGEEEEDDGSGLGWVRKRKEARERERVRREEEEKQTQNAADGDAAPGPASAASPPATTEGSPEHILTAITLPAPPHAPRRSSHQHSHSQSHSPEPTSTPIPIPTPPDEKAAEPQGEEHHILTAVRRPDSGVGGLGLTRMAPEAAASEETVRAVPGGTAGAEAEESSSESELGEEEDEEDSDDEEEDGSADEDEKRKTALGAGVEKISRHKDKEREEEEA